MHVEPHRKEEEEPYSAQLLPSLDWHDELLASPHGFIGGKSMRIVSPREDDVVWRVVEADCSAITRVRAVSKRNEAIHASRTSSGRLPAGNILAVDGSAAAIE